MWQKYNPENIQATPTIETSPLVTTDSSQPPDVSTSSILSVSDVVKVGSLDASPAVPYGHLSPSVQTRLSNLKTEPAGEPYGALSASVQSRLSNVQPDQTSSFQATSRTADTSFGSSATAQVSISTV